MAKLSSLLVWSLRLEWVLLQPTPAIPVLGSCWWELSCVLARTVASGLEWYQCAYVRYTHHITSRRSIYNMFIIFLLYPPGCNTDSITDPRNGSVAITSPGGVIIASYTCDVGYELVGVALRICRSDGHFSAQEPVCQGECTAGCFPNEYFIL